MDRKIVQDKNIINKFLKNIHKITENPSFNEKTDFFIVNRANNDSDDLYTNAGTLSLLNYDTKDVLEEVLKLKYEDYKETLLDTMYNNIFLYVFEKEISNLKMYIKITCNDNKIIICYSFHISKEEK